MANEILSERALIATYDPPVDVGAPTLVKQYDRAMDLVAENPDRSDLSIARQLEVPRGRIRTWTDGGMPDAARGRDRARRRGWVPLEAGDDALPGIARLHAWIYAGGSINRHWTPHWAVGGGSERALLCDAAERAGVDLEEVRPESDERGREFRPAADGSVFGRVLAALDAPVGGKSEHSDIVVPDWLNRVSVPVRAAWVETYLRVRGHWTGGAGTTLQLTERRLGSYRQQLVGLLAEFIDREHISATNPHVTIAREGVEQFFGGLPEL